VIENRTKIRYIVRVLSAVCCLCAAGFGLLNLLWLLIYGKPPEIATKKAEFPFSLVFEINGERKIIEDTLICEYDGTESNAGIMMRYPVWRIRYASGQNGIILLEDHNQANVLEVFEWLSIGKPWNKSDISTWPGEPKLYGQIVFNPGSPQYFMGDTSNPMADIKNDDASTAFRIIDSRNFRWKHYVGREIPPLGSGMIEIPLNSLQLKSLYAIEIISWEIAAPITNDIRYRWD